MLQKKYTNLIEIAKNHARTTYKDKITSMAAILLTKKGNIYTGINVKYKKIWKCICAERVAIAKAIEAGETDFDSIVTVKFFPETESFEVMNMCGECRQLSIFHKNLHVIVNDNGQIKLKPIANILPYAYT